MKCKFCQHYQIQGHRGGECQILGALMDGRQESCSLAVPAFCAAQAPTLTPETHVTQDIVWELERVLCLAISTSPHRS